MDILELSFFQMQIRQDLGKIEDPSQDTVFIGGNLVSWKNKKQNLVSRSSAESKYRAMTVCL